jgi:hypothetical protein
MDACMNSIVIALPGTVSSSRVPIATNTDLMTAPLPDNIPAPGPSRIDDGATLKAPLCLARSLRIGDELNKRFNRKNAGSGRSLSYV